MPKKILLLSPYDVASHCYWREGLVQSFPEYEWTVLTLEPRYFAWRMRGNSLIWAYEQEPLLTQHYDLVLACSMTDLSSLRGFIPSLATIPTLLYCHENQFYYPSNTQQQGQVEQQIIQLYNFECADKIIFNSTFNKNTCLDGIHNLLKKLPDHVPKKLLDNIREKCAVLPVPLKDEDFINTENDLQTKNNTFTITWNHRWEYDKGLKQLHALLEKIVACENNWKVNILGQSFREVPSDMQACIQLIEKSQCKGVIGFVANRTEYLNLLAKSHVVLSTSLHEFQGLAIMEAVKLQCIPVLPKRLSYPEFFPESYLYTSCEDDIKQESEHAFSKLLKVYEQWQTKNFAETTMLSNTMPMWKNEKAAYQSFINELIRG